MSQSDDLSVVVSETVPVLGIAITFGVLGELLNLLWLRSLEGLPASRGSFLFEAAQGLDTGVTFAGIVLAAGYLYLRVAALRDERPDHASASDHRTGR